MRKLIVTLAALAAAAQPLAAQQHHHHHAGGHGAGALPAGWHARVDRAQDDVGRVRFAAMSGGYHVTTGPAVILWNGTDNVASGNYAVRATFNQTKAPTHPEAYGLFVAGSNLSANADYMYFLVRGDGKYMVRHRAPNGDVHTIVPWTEHAAIRKQNAQGQASNALLVEGGDWGLRLKVNGTQVGEWLKKDVPYLTTAGQVGLRVNHNLDVHVADYGVTRG